MKKTLLWQWGAILTMVLLFSSCKKDLPCNCDGNDGKATMQVFATGFNNPRGLKFGPDNNLYVAEGGVGGTNMTGDQCTQVPAPVGPYKGSPTGGRISKVSMTGVRTTLTDQLPSSVNSLGEISGVGDVTFMNNTLYAVITGGGCSHGVPSVPNSVVKVNKDGSWSMVANLSSWLMGHPAKNPEPDDFEPDGDWYSMTHVGNALYAIESNHGELVKVLPNGNVSRIADISASQGHIVPTAIVYRDGYFYVGNLNPFPIVAGSSKVYRVSLSGEVQEYALGFTTILGLAFDKKGSLYVLENTTGGSNAFPTPGTGRIVRLDKEGNRKDIVTGLSLPTAMTFGPDDKLYVSNMGFGPGAIGGGEVVQVTLNDCNCDCGDLGNKLPF